MTSPAENLVNLLRKELGDDWSLDIDGRKVVYGYPSGAPEPTEASASFTARHEYGEWDVSWLEPSRRGFHEPTDEMGDSASAEGAVEYIVSKVEALDG